MLHARLCSSASEPSPRLPDDCRAAEVPGPRLGPPGYDPEGLAARTGLLLARIPVVALRFVLDGLEWLPPIARLRGVFGAALHDLDARAYREVFAPPAEQGAPAYLVRPAPRRPGRSTAIDFHVFGRGVDYLALIGDAWRTAGQRGVGKRRRRFDLGAWDLLDAGGRPVPDQSSIVPFSLDRVPWPLAGDPRRTACRLEFVTPLRLLRRRRLIHAPDLRDLVVGACRRFAGVLPLASLSDLHRLRDVALEVANGTAACPWIGADDRVRRYSASQDCEVELRGVVGFLDLPDGPGELWRLLAALRWLHCGKATVVGLGQLQVSPQY